MEDPRRTEVDEENTPLLPVKTKFSWTILAALLVYTAIVNSASELVWPFINQLILSVGIAPDEKSVGFYSGLIETIASCFSFAAIMPGSLAADRWGRKIVLCSTLIGTFIGLTFFGISTTLVSLIFFRCVGYALGPQLGWATSITILGDVSDSSNSGLAFSSLNAAYRFGQLFSPIFASTLSHPKTRYRWFQSDFWEHHPYALPCWAGAVTCVVGLFITVSCVPETAPSMVDPKLGDSEYVEGAVAGDLRPKNLTSDPASVQMTPAITESLAGTSAERPKARIFTPHITQLLLSSWIMYFMTVGFVALFPLWAFTPITSGGLGASEVAIGSLISARAVAQFVVLIPFAYFEARLGVYRLYAYSMAIFTIVGTIGFPLLNMIARWEGIMSLRFNAVTMVYFILGGAADYCLTCMGIMINQASPTPHDLAQLVGMSQSALMLGQSMAPIVVLSIFELSIKSDLLGGNIIWVFLIGCALVSSAHAFMLRAPVSDEYLMNN